MSRLLFAFAAAITCIQWSVLTAQGPQKAADNEWQARFRLVRCDAKRDEACLDVRLEWPANRAREGGEQWNAALLHTVLAGEALASAQAQDTFAQGNAAQNAKLVVVSPTFLAPNPTAGSLARTALRGAIALRDQSRSSTQFTGIVTWRPPRIAFPLFSAAAATGALSTGNTEALALAVQPPPVRSLIALLLVIIGTILVLFVPRFLWSNGHESDEDVARQLAAARALLTAQELEHVRANTSREARPREPEEPTENARPRPRS